MRSYAFVVAAISLTGSLVVAGCGTGGINGPGLDSVKVSITSPTSSQTIQAGQTVNITAAVSNAKSDPGVSWTVSGAGSAGGALANPTLTTVTYDAPAVVTADTTVIITATSVANPAVSASLTVTISSTATNNDALLSGQYAFLVSGFNSSMAASITTDGNGTVTGGEEDILSPTTSLSGADVAITSGTYFVGADNRGALTYTDANGNSFTFALALGKEEDGVATKGEMIESDTNPLEMTGSLGLQNTSAFTQQEGLTPYAFGLPGWDGAGAPMVSAGRFAVSSGNVFAGLLDQNDNGTITSAAHFSGSLSSIDSSGRGTLTFQDDAGTSTYVVYIISCDKWLAIGTGSNGGVSYGDIEQEFGRPYSSSSLDGNAVFVNQTETGVPSPNAELGLMTFDGNQNVSYSFDQDAGGGADLTSSGSTTYTFTSDFFSRFTISGVGVGYMIGYNRAFIISENPGAPTQVGFGTLEPQWNDEEFSNSSVQGSFFFGTLSLVSPPAPSVNYGAPPPLIYSSGVLTLDGEGDVAGTVDANASGFLLTSGVALTDTYSVGANGRATTGSGDEVIYIVSPTKFYYLTFPSGTAGNPTIGVGEQLGQQESDGVRQPGHKP